MERNCCVVRFHDRSGISAIVIAKRVDKHTIHLGASFFNPKDRLEKVQPTVKEGVSKAKERLDSDPIEIKYDTKAELMGEWESLLNRWPDGKILEMLSEKYGEPLVYRRLMFAT